MATRDKATWRGTLSYTGARHVPGPPAFFLMCRLEREPDRLVKIEATRLDAQRMFNALRRFLETTDAADELIPGQLPLAQILERYPAEFGLRAFPGKRFRVAAAKCWQEKGEAAQIVVQVHNPARAQELGRDGEEWLDFGRETAATLDAEIVR